MKTFRLITALLLVSWTSAFAQSSGLSVEIITSFDYPGEGNSTSAQGINDNGDITGSYDDSNGVTRSFIRYSDGTFSEPFIEPNDTDGFTFARDLNNLGVLGGSYGTADGETHGFLLSAGAYTQFDASKSVSTYIYGLNDRQDLVGVAYATDVSFGLAYARINGITTTIALPSAKTSSAYGINNAREVVGLYHERGNSNYHGFYRAPDGIVTAPIDAAGASTTFLSGINEKGLIVGRYGDANGTQHGLVFKMPSTYLSFDYPGATYTSTSGINNQGYVTGRFQTGDGIFHSYLGRVRLGR